MSLFTTPQEAEAAFYQAFEQASLEQMMLVWARQEEISCVHPMGRFLRGLEAIEKSWREVFRAGPKMRFQLSDTQYQCGTEIAVHTLCENITVIGSEQAAIPVLTTNIYQRIGGSWRMILHHASLSPAEAKSRKKEHEKSEGKIILH